MSVSAAALQELHRLHSQLTDLRGRLERGPKQVAARQANVAKLAADLQAAQDLVKQTKLLGDQKQLELDSSDQRIADWQMKLNSCANNKEYNTMQEQIAAAEMANSVLSDEILEMFDRVDSLTASAKRAEEILESGKQELAKITATVEQNAENLRSEIARLEADLKTAEGALSGDFKAEYFRIVGAKGADGMAEADGGVCGGCGQTITLNKQSQLAMSEPVFCQSCGCLLYLSE